MRYDDVGRTSIGAKDHVLDFPHGLAVGRLDARSDESRGELRMDLVGLRGGHASRRTHLRTRLVGGRLGRGLIRSNATHRSFARR